MTDKPELLAHPERTDTLVASGNWQIDQISGLSAAIANLPADIRSIDARGVRRLDSFGVLLLLRAASRLGLAADAIEIDDEHRHLVAAVAAAREDSEVEPARLPPWVAFLDHVGEAVTTFGGGMKLLVGFLGLTLSALARTVFRPRQWRITSTVHHMEQTGLNAMPLVALLSFLIGAVVAYLGATVLKDFGAELFVVDLTTYAFFREMGVLVTAIVLAGRTASAFTAQIGTMKSREEIDAMQTLGLDPIVLLVLPRLIALIFMLPILTAVATLSGMLGGWTVAVTSLDIGSELFISRLHEIVELRHFLVGLVKAPLFATVIALVGCLEGFKVAGTAQSVGERTTSAVVQSISLVIVINALAAVFFMEMGW